MGNQTDDLSENRRKDKNILSMPQETHKPKQNSVACHMFLGAPLKG